MTSGGSPRLSISLKSVVQVLTVLAFLLLALFFWRRSRPERVDLAAGESFKTDGDTFYGLVYRNPDLQEGPRVEARSPRDRAHSAGQSELGPLRRRVSLFWGDRKTAQPLGIPDGRQHSARAFNIDTLSCAAEPMTRIERAPLARYRLLADGVNRSRRRAAHRTV